MRSEKGRSSSLAGPPGGHQLTPEPGRSLGGKRKTTGTQPASSATRSASSKACRRRVPGRNARAASTPQWRQSRAAAWARGASRWGRVRRRRRRSTPAAPRSRTSRRTRTLRLRGAWRCQSGGQARGARSRGTGCPRPPPGRRESTAARRAPRRAAGSPRRRRARPARQRGVHWRACSEASMMLGGTTTETCSPGGSTRTRPATPAPPPSTAAALV